MKPNDRTPQEEIIEKLDRKREDFYFDEKSYGEVYETNIVYFPSVKISLTKQEIKKIKTLESKKDKAKTAARASKRQLCGDLKFFDSYWKDEQEYLKCLEAYIKYITHLQRTGRNLCE